MVDRPADTSRDIYGAAGTANTVRRGVLDDARHDLDGENSAIPRNTGHAEHVVACTCDRASYVCAVPDLILWPIVAHGPVALEVRPRRRRCTSEIDQVLTRQQQWGKLNVIEIHAGIDNRHDDGR